MRYLLIILLFVTLSAKAQEAFVLGKTYRQGWIVWYPSNSPEYYYMSIPISVRARTTPDLDPANWVKVNKEKPVPTAPVVVVGAVTQSSFDSLLTRVRQLEEKQVTIDIINKKVDAIEQAPLFTLKISQLGFPLLKINSNGTITMRSIVQGTGTTLKLTDSTIVLPK